MSKNTLKRKKAHTFTLNEIYRNVNWTILLKQINGQNIIFRKLTITDFIVTYIHTTHIKSIDMNKYLKFTCITGTSYRILSKIFQKMSCIA